MKSKIMKGEACGSPHSEYGRSLYEQTVKNREKRELEADLRRVRGGIWDWDWTLFVWCVLGGVLTIGVVLGSSILMGDDRANWWAITKLYLDRFPVQGLLTAAGLLGGGLGYLLHSLR